jgi:DNA polymerase-1
MIEHLSAAGVQRGDLLALAVAPGVGVGLASAHGRLHESCADPVDVLRTLEEQLRPRWVWWSIDTPRTLIEAGLRVSTCWDLGAVHRLVYGGWKADPARLWSALHGLPTSSIPAAGQLDLTGGDGSSTADDEPVRADGHLRADWVLGRWADSPQHMAAWADIALQACSLQQDALAGLHVAGRPLSTARAESAAELLCAELSLDGLPLDVEAAEDLIAELVGPRPRSEAEAARSRAERDAQVLRYVPGSSGIDLRNPAQVKTLLRRAGIEVPDTRAWRLEQLRAQHPVVEALLQWRKAERVATTYGYSWLDTHIGLDGRLRGAWSGSDGAAGRMTAQAGLHNMPADMRSIVVADPGHVFVRADLGQIEPRVLAAVSGDRALAAATVADDLYAPVAQRLGVERAAAKVAVLAAMYGQTSGTAGQALRGLRNAYPVAMEYLDAADREGQSGRDVRTYGGRLVRMWSGPALDEGDSGDDRAVRSAAAARGRYARNAMVQGAAAELFKVWAAFVRARVTPLGARIVLCLHDELLVHSPFEHADTVRTLLDSCLREAARAWSPDDSVRFVAETSIIQRWSDAKASSSRDLRTTHYGGKRTDQRGTAPDILEAE